MNTSTQLHPGTAVATRERIDAQVAENKARNAVVAAIRGTQWGRDTTPDMARAVAQYCRENNLDPVRHVEILGGRIYLTAELYDEKGAALVRAGVVRPAEPDFIHADARLDELAKGGDEWAITESTRRIRERIKHGVPEKALAAVVQRFHIQDGATILGVNWAGGTGRRDPVGDAEPTKTALTRARRRAWKQIADIIPGYADAIRPIEVSARLASGELPVEVVEAPRGPKALAAASGDDPYASAPTSAPPVAPGSVDDHAEADRGVFDEELALGTERNTPTARRTDALREG
jgi:hypothetical protein